LFSRALEGLRHLWMHEPLRLLWLGSAILALAYEQLTGGASLETVGIAIATLVITELGRSVVTSPATADPDHFDPE